MAQEAVNYVESADGLRRTTAITWIPEGATENTYPGYWLDGSYSTYVTEKGTLDFELEMSLHVPELTLDAMYMNWHQFYDDEETQQQDDDELYWESYACTIRFN